MAVQTPDRTRRFESPLFLQQCGCNNYFACGGRSKQQKVIRYQRMLREHERVHRMGALSDASMEAR
ncbi:MAG: hypothetical protein AMJ54_07570 [Deltaproteobacteria bacterium SG8_13]|nr:MAG: hypothetical protein AMJ54_07570 [Deltaproteobacteria bacterium SG8_13]